MPIATRRHDKIPVEKVSFKIPSVQRSKTRSGTQQDVLGASHFVIEDEGATIRRLPAKD